MSIFNGETTCNPQYRLKYLRSINIKHTYLNVETVLQLYLTMPRTNCSSKRFFSVLKRIKTRLGYCLIRDKLDNLTHCLLLNNFFFFLNGGGGLLKIKVPGPKICILPAIELYL